jgi:phosphatidylglycerophosphate synthase
MADDSGILGILFDTVNMAVEQYLAHVIKPFLTLHEKFYKALNSVLRTFLDDNSDNIPKWFTANAITYVRTWMVIPNLLLLVHGYNFLPFLIVLGVDFGDFLDGVVARYWVDRKHIEAVGEEVPGDDSKDKPKMMASEIVKHREKNYGGFIDAVCDKAFVVPCWISLLSTVPSAGCVRTIQFIVLWCLILTETASGCIRFKAYYSSNGVAAPTVKGLDFSTSAVKADHIGKAKQTFEMVGTALFILPLLRYAGLLLLAAAVPLAYESVRRKITTRVMYVDGTTEKFNHETIKFWKQAKALGSKLIVGITEDDKDMIANASASESVDFVLLNAPYKLSLSYLDGIGVDYVVCGVGQSVSVVSTELAAAKRCLVIIDDNTAIPMESKSTKAE